MMYREVQSLRPFPLQSTSVCISLHFRVHACDKLEQDKQSQYRKKMHIFLLREVRVKGSKESRKARKPGGHKCWGVTATHFCIRKEDKRTTFLGY